MQGESTPSSVHVKVEFPSDDENANSGDAPLTPPSSGPPVIDVCGAVVSTVQVRDAVPVLPAASVACAANVCDPSESPVFGVPQAVVCPSSVQLGVPSLLVTVKLADELGGGAAARRAADGHGRA